MVSPVVLTTSPMGSGFLSVTLNSDLTACRSATLAQRGATGEKAEAEEARSRRNAANLAIFFS